MEFDKINEINEAIGVYENRLNSSRSVDIDG